MLGLILSVLRSSDLWAATLQFAALLLLPALGGVISERGGITNIAMEGMMLTGACAGVMVARATNNVLLGVVGAIVAATLISLIHALVSINFKANQVVSGIAINLFALGLTNYIVFIQTAGQGVPSLNDSLRLPQVSLGPLSNIPFIGPVFLQQNIIFYVAVVILFATQFLLFHTNFGLRIRAVGEHPHAADTAGVNVRLMRYICVGASGAFAGLAGAYLSLGIAGVFTSNMTAGTGFIALAAMIFGKWTPWGTAGACVVFGLGEALVSRLQGPGIDPNLLSTLPYILTLFALVGLVGRTIPPAADGVPYEPGTE
ncbi:ABC transporter permease [Ktedonobacter sp. SOSP1-85]|uniref:ABC transporter permease n=1 Tax=Ktedonobacter sp. SOSP1-85 TaxID=2778367 RepID=UPI0019167AC8|nr:ABC transporter permease [Ktedonobacter sp. SOSP1-85]GHO75067.1 ABC transporter permease [Ktedonobacter sp. SOSP1-85]